MTTQVTEPRTSPGATPGTDDPHESQAMFEALFDHTPKTDPAVALAVPRYRRKDSRP